MDRHRREVKLPDFTSHSKERSSDEGVFVPRNSWDVTSVSSLSVSSLSERTVIPSLFTRTVTASDGSVIDRSDRCMFQIISADGRALLTVERK